MINEIDNGEVPEYSTEALNVLRYFHDCEVIIFVEGEDDILFWDVISNKAGLLGAKIEAAGGKNELAKKIYKILNENAQIVVACDLDHSPFLNYVVYHEKIVRTYGYSIENSMYCPASINSLIKKLSRTIIESDQAASELLNAFVNNARRLLIYDIANHRYQKGISIFGDNCSKFLRSKNSILLSKTKIERFINLIGHRFTKSEIEECEQLVQNDSRELRYLIKGHFLTNAVINIVKKRVSELKRRRLKMLTTEHLYTETIDYCKNCIPSECQELLYMVENLKNAYKAAKKD